MMRRWIILTLLFFILVYMPLLAETKTVRIGIYSWEPYLSPMMERSGMFTEIVSAALEDQGYQINIVNYPFARILHSLEMGSIDMSVAISRSTDRSQYIEYTLPFYELEMGFLFKKDTLQFNTIKDLKPFTGGILRKSFWSEVLDEAGVGYHEVAEVNQNIKMLAIDRVDFVCMPKDLGFALLSEMGENPDLYDFGLYIREGQLVGISKKSPLKSLRDDFERGLKHIKMNGEFEAIVSSYQL